VLVGVPAGEFEESPEGAVPMAMVAAVHEFGCPEKNIPERSFLRGGIRRGAPKFQRLNAANLRAIVLGGKTVAEALGQLGAVAAGEVKREFTAGTFAPNKPATIARKGSSRPLIDTGSLRQSITWQLEGSESSHARIVR
jgi:phage gpG-like protein